jgi:hypothetical protein
MGKNTERRLFLEKRAETNQEKRGCKGRKPGTLGQGEGEEKKVSSQV